MHLFFRPVLIADQEGLYKYFGVQDQLTYPPTDEAIRLCLHKWMPRTGVFIAGTPLMGGRGGSLTATGTSPYQTASSMSSSSSLSSPARMSPAQRKQARLFSPMPATMQSPKGLGCPLRVLLVAACPLSALTLMQYCEIFAIWVEHDTDAESAMRRLCAMQYSSARPYDLVIVEPDLPGEMSAFALCAWWKEQVAAQAALLADKKIQCEASAPSNPTGGRQRRPSNEGRLITDQPGYRQCRPSNEGRLITDQPAVETDFVMLAHVPDAEACAAFGMKACLAKPLSVRCFATMLHQWLQSRSAPL